jgi:MFS family permease
MPANSIAGKTILRLPPAVHRAGIRLEWGMLRVAASIFVFLGGFAVMVLEIIGARFLAKDFGGSFYVWISQIGVILIALALGYAIGGALADRFARRPSSTLAQIAGVFTLLIPNFTEPLINAIVTRHPLDRGIPLVAEARPGLRKHAGVFLPCLILATLPPYMIRVTAQQVEQVGTISGLIYAASTVGSIAGVFVSGYVLIDYMAVPDIFRATGGLTLLLAGLSLALDRWIRTEFQPSR